MASPLNPIIDIVPFISFSVKHIHKSKYIAMFQIKRGVMLFTIFIFSEQFFIFGVALLPASMESTSTESLQEHKHFSDVREPHQYLDGFSYFISLPRKPFSFFTFFFHFFYFIFFIGLCIGTYLFHGAEE